MSDSVYLSLLVPSYRSAAARRDLSDGYELHRTLSRAFPEGREYGEARCLFRLDETRSGPRVLVQSRIAPDWTPLSECGYLLGMPEVKEWKPEIPAATCLAFRLRANPTVKKNGKRQPLLTEELQLQWFQRKAVENGFVPLRVAVTAAPVVTATTGCGRETLHHAVRFDGVLRVVDPAKFADAVRGGIGSAKGFGFGLLSVARLK